METDCGKCQTTICYEADDVIMDVKTAYVECWRCEHWTMIEIEEED